MSLQDWERDIRNRQRNIVFPDTVLNEGRFYRNIASGKAVFSTGQWICLCAILAYWMLVTLLYFATAIAELNQKHHGYVAAEFPLCFYMLANLSFWAFMALKGFLSRTPPARKRRRGYRSSGRG
ncbi:MAG TPA: hypothetical protein VGK24_19735 [Candidatus Angelobacter sp.]|jgi:hypothetical protein